MTRNKDFQIGMAADNLVYSQCRFCQHYTRQASPRLPAKGQFCHADGHVTVIKRSYKADFRSPKEVSDLLAAGKIKIKGDKGTDTCCEEFCEHPIDTVERAVWELWNGAKR